MAVTPCISLTRQPIAYENPSLWIAGRCVSMMFAGETAVVGVDGTDFAKAEIAKNGPFKATVAQDFDTMAKQLADLVDQTLAGPTPDKDLYLVPGTLIGASE